MKNVLNKYLLSTAFLFVSLIFASQVSAAPIPITVSSIKIAKIRSFAATIEIETSIGRITGTGNLQHGPTVCSTIAPCLSGTLMNTQFLLSGLTGVLNGQDVYFSLGNGGWIDQQVSWRIPYVTPRGRPIRKDFVAVMYPGTMTVFQTSDPNISYAAPMSMTGSMKVMMSPLQRFQAPAPYTDFTSVEINMFNQQ